jgi:two-component system, cell cycle response regulator
MPTPIFRPLAVSLIRKTFVIATVCALGVAAVQAYVANQQAREYFSLSLRDVATTSVPVLSMSLWDIEPQVVRRQVQAIAQRYQIGYVRLELRTGQVYEAGKLAMRQAGNSEHFEIPYPYQKTGLLGVMDIWPDTDALHAEVVRRVLAVVLGYGLLTGLICIMLALVLRRDLQHPMQRLAEFVNRMRPESLTRPLKLERPAARVRDEIDLVADGFRTLQESLNHHITNLDQLVADRTKELNAAIAAVHELSITDPLTGCFNRRLFNERFQTEMERSIRYARPLSIAFCDIDHFKRINDNSGHAVGDRVLVQVVERLRQHLRQDVDWMSRYGGEEFVIVQPETSLPAAQAAAERLRLAIAEAVIDVAGYRTRVTASFGVAQLAPRESAAALLNRADALLYEAKQAGRNRVYPPLPEA